MNKLNCFSRSAAVLLILILLLSLSSPVYALLSETEYKLISDMVYSYRTLPDASQKQIRQDLASLKSINPSLGKTWEELMEYWMYVNNDLVLHYDVLPDGLPEDDSLCITVLGYQLLPDGSMDEELIGRCSVALRCAERYPKAFIAVTGGGTAMMHPDLTEAGQMADWLMEHGISKDRIIVEDNSQTTAENALFTYRLLKEIPQIRAIAIVTSDYHVSLGCLLFQEQFLLSSYVEGENRFSVFTNAAFHQESLMSFTPRNQALDVWMLSETILNS